MSTDNKFNPNDDAVNAGEGAKKALNTMRANLSMNAEDETVGSGLMAVHMDRGLMKQLKKDKKKTRKDKAFNAALASMEALRIHRGELETDLGGLDTMGGKVGLERKEGETDDEYRKRLKDEIYLQEANGTLNDPTGKLKEWADTQDAIEQKMAMEAKQVHALEAAPIEEIKRAVKVVEDNVAHAARLSNNIDVSKAAVVENTTRLDKGSATMVDVDITQETARDESMGDFLDLDENFSEEYTNLAPKETFNTKAEGSVIASTDITPIVSENSYKLIV